MDELLKDAREVNEAPSGFGQFVIEKAKEKAPKFYAWCEQAWQALQKKRENVQTRRRAIPARFAEMADASAHRDDDQREM